MHPLRKWNEKHKWLLAVLALGLTATLLLLWVLALTWPYALFTYGEPGPVKTDEFTSTGLPVVRTDDALRWDQPFCNYGQTTYTHRWIDIYGTATAAGFIDTDYDDEVLVASFEVPAITFYAQQDLCDTTEVFAVIPNYVPPGSAYRFRIASSYQPNAIRTVTETVSTEKFLLLDPGDPIP
jgi:hypothetical protein